MAHKQTSFLKNPVKEARSSQGLTQESTAEKAGLSRATISRMENERATSSASRQKVVRALRIGNVPNAE